MLSLTARIELLEKDLSATPPAFTMNADLPFALFRYDPTKPGESEWEMRRQMKLLATRVEKTTGKSVHLLSLAKFYWQSIEQTEGVATIVGLEQESGFPVAEAQVHCYLSDPDWRPLPQLLAEAVAAFQPERDILFLYRAGVFAPTSYRISSLLEQLMGDVSVPAVLFYPGSWRAGSLNYLGLRGEQEPLGSYRVKIYGREA